MTTAKRHPPISIHSFAHRLCSWCPSSNACSTWNSLTPTIWSWSVQWWRSKGGQCLATVFDTGIPPKEKTILDKNSPHVCNSNNFKALWKWGREECARNWLAKAYHSIPSHSFRFCLSNHPANSDPSYHYYKSLQMCPLWMPLAIYHLYLIYQTSSFDRNCPAMAGMER